MIKLYHGFPSDALNDTSYGGAFQSECARNGSLPHSGGAKATDFLNDDRCDVSTGGIYPERRSTLLCFVAHIVRVCTSKQMIRSYARRVIAAVEYLHPIGNRANQKRICDPMCAGITSHIGERSVVTISTLPIPAPISGYLNKLPEAIKSTPLIRTLSPVNRAPLTVRAYSPVHSLIEINERFECFTRKAKLFLYNRVGHELNLLKQRFSLWLGSFGVSAPFGPLAFYHGRAGF